MSETTLRPFEAPMRRGASLLGALVCLGSMACSSPPPLLPQPDSPPESSYLVGPPDELLLTILPEPIIERAITVRPDGMISVDLIGDVKASGRPVTEISKEIQERIGRYKRDARATLAVVMARSNQVTVFGEVVTPGTFELVRDTRVAEAIGLRGGSTIFATKSKLRVIRSDGQVTQVLKVDLNGIQKGDLSSNIMLTGGDIVVVPPNIGARIGYKLKSFLFPFQQILSATIAAVPLAAIF